MAGFPLEPDACPEEGRIQLPAAAELVDQTAADLAFVKSLLRVNPA
jgi:hypothetical protein